MDVKSQKESELIAQGVDPALAAQIAETAMLQAQLAAGEADIERNRDEYGTRTPGRYGTFVGNPIGAAIGGYQSGRAMGERPGLMRQGNEAAAATAAALRNRGMPSAGTPPITPGTNAAGVPGGAIPQMSEEELNRLLMSMQGGGYAGS